MEESDHHALVVLSGNGRGDEEVDDPGHFRKKLKLHYNKMRPCSVRDPATNHDQDLRSSNVSLCHTNTSHL